MNYSFKNKPQKNTIAVLDGVRAFACLNVLAFHLHLIGRDLHVFNLLKIGPLASSIAMTGSAGVTLFFNLSGFLLFMPYARALLFDAPWPGMRQFYVKRALRILPGYYTALFLLVLLQHREYLQPAHLGEFGLFLTFFMDSTPLTWQKINGPFWTLAVEWQFYLLLPLIALGLRWTVRRVAPQKRWWVLALGIVGVMAWGIGTRAAGIYSDAHPAATFLLPTPVFQTLKFFLYGTSGKFLEDFAVGMLISMFYLFTRQAASDHPLSKHLLRASTWLWGAGILWLLVVSLWHYDQWFHIDPALFFFDPVTPAYGLLGEIFLSLGFGLCMTALLFGPSYLKQPFEWRPLRWLGLISYSLYMWHLPILAEYGQHILFIGSGNMWLYVLLWGGVACIVIPFAYGMYKWIEEPWIRVAGKIGRKAMA